MSAEIILGDCLNVLAEGRVPGDAVIVSDPPYGIDHDTDYSRFTGGVASHSQLPSVSGDDAAFDPSPWLAFRRVILFGANCFSDRLPKGTWLIWCKRRDLKLGKFMSDAEVAWQKGGHGVYILRHIWDGFDRETERGQPRIHPTQKPVAVMEWAIRRLRLPPKSLIVDPYCGSGTTGVAALRLGHHFIGIEQSADYADLARRRVGEGTGSEAA